MRKIIMAVILTGIVGGVNAADFAVLQGFKAADIQISPATNSVPVAIKADDGRFTMSCYVTGFSFAYNSTEILARDLRLTEKDTEMKKIVGKYGTVFYRVNSNTSMGPGHYTLIFRFDKTSTVALTDAWNAKIPYLVTGFTLRDEWIYASSDTGSISCAMWK